MSELGHIRLLAEQIIIQHGQLKSLSQQSRPLAYHSNRRQKQYMLAAQRRFPILLIRQR